MLDITVLVFLIAPSDDAAVNREAKRLEGNWEIVAAEQGGQKQKLDEVRFQAIVFADAAAFGKKEVSGGVILNATLDPTRSPKVIRATEADPGKRKPLQFAGVYADDGEKIKVCLGPADSAPTAFETKGDPGTTLLELKRVKDLPEPRGPSALAKKLRARTAVEQLTVAVGAYKLAVEQYPAKLEDLTQPPGKRKPFVEKENLTDPWGRPYRYDPKGPRNEGQKPDIWSDGPDGKGEVIGNWQGEKPKGKDRKE